MILSCMYILENGNEHSCIKIYAREDGSHMMASALRPGRQASWGLHITCSERETYSIVNIVSYAVSLLKKARVQLIWEHGSIANYFDLINYDLQKLEKLWKGLQISWFWIHLTAKFVKAATAEERSLKLRWRYHFTKEALWQVKLAVWIKAMWNQL